MEKIHYFAYGSNMNHEQMKERCNNPVFICKGFLENYDFVYDGYSTTKNGSAANIIPKEGSIVWGAIWLIDEGDIKRLDEEEDYPYVYKIEKVIVKDDENKEYKEWVYLRDKKDLGNPSYEHGCSVIEGARQYNLPDDYIKE